MFAYCGNNPVSGYDPTGNWPEWLKDAVKWVSSNVVKPVVKTVQAALSQTDFTLSTGINISGTPSFWIFNGQIGPTLDSKGNIAIQYSLGGGFTVGNPSLSIAGYTSITNAPSINDLNGLCYQFGGSVIVPVERVPVFFGDDISIIPNEDGGKNIYGNSFSAGLAAGSAGGEGHVEWGKTGTIGKTQINIFSFARYVYRRIMEWE